MDGLLSPLLKRTKILLCILFEEHILTLATFSIGSKQLGLLTSTQVMFQKMSPQDTSLLHLPLIIQEINRFIATHTTKPTFVMIIQPHNSVSPATIFEYQLLAHCLSLILTHIISTKDARMKALELKEDNSTISSELRGGAHIFMEDL